MNGAKLGNPLKFSDFSPHEMFREGLSGVLPVSYTSIQSGDGDGVCVRLDYGLVRPYDSAVLTFARSTYRFNSL